MPIKKRHGGVLGLGGGGGVWLEILHRISLRISSYFWFFWFSLFFFMKDQLILSMANYSRGIRGIIFWTKWGKKEWTISVIGFVILSLALILTFDSSSSSWSKDRNPNHNDFTTTLDDDDSLVDLILLRNAKERGAGNQILPQFFILKFTLFFTSFLSSCLIRFASWCTQYLFVLT